MNEKMGGEMSGYEVRQIIGRQLREEERGGNEDLIGSCCPNSRAAEQSLSVSDTV